MTIKLVSPYNVVKEVKLGWSWTTFFFGCFPALFRGDLKWAGIMFAISFAAIMLTAGFSSFVTVPLFAAVYNKMYITDLVNKGYTAFNEAEENTLRQYIS